MDRDESGIVRQCLQGDQDACTRLVERYAAMVGTVIWRATGRRDAVDDLAQETFLRVFRGLPYFDGRAKLSTWVFTIAHRVAVDHLRRASRAPVAACAGDEADSKLGRLPSPAPDPEETMSRGELGRLVRAQLARLPEKYRLPLVYSTIDGLDHATIASMLNVKAGAVKTLVFRAKELLIRHVDAELGTMKVSRNSDAV